MSDTRAHPDTGSHSAFEAIDHRPWPLPDGRWQWRQLWCDLLFAHWPVAVEAIRPLVPPALTVQTFDGAAWLGVVPFRMEGVSRRPLPDIPGLSVFPEINVRVYVVRDGKPGVWFLSLDATSRLAVAVGRYLFHVPYYLARMSIEPDQDGFRFSSDRRDKPGPARFVARYEPVSAIYHALPDTIDHFLTERYCLYAAAPDGSISRTDVHHAPWPLQSAVANITSHTMAVAAGVPVSGPPPLLHFSRGVDVVVWPAQRLDSQ